MHGFKGIVMKRLWALVDLSGLDDETLAKGLDAHKTTPWRWRRGDRKMRLDDVDAVLEVLGEQPARLFAPVIDAGDRRVLEMLHGGTQISRSKSAALTLDRLEGEGLVIFDGDTLTLTPEGHSYVAG